MKRLVLTILLVTPLLLLAQTPEEFIIEIEPFEIANAPGVHSYSWGKPQIISGLFLEVE